MQRARQIYAAGQIPSGWLLSWREWSITIPTIEGRTFTMPNSKQQWHINHNIKISTQAKFQQGSIKGYLPEYCDGDQVWCIQDDTRELMQNDVAIIVSAMCEPIMFEPELPPEQFGFIISFATHSVWKYTQQEEYQMIHHITSQMFSVYNNTWLGFSDRQHIALSEMLFRWHWHWNRWRH